MPDRLKIVRRARSGQTLIVAIAVLFILLVIGALFITQIARNLAFSGRSRDTQQADALARAGVQFCDQQLTYSADGADWRPVPTAPFTSLKDPLGVSDPDYEWLSAGFTRMNLKGGRALVRITYDPHPDDPRSQFLKIESIGRPGQLGNGSTIDPTVFVQSGAAPRLRRELIAYKQLALTDYVLFDTDLDKTHKTASLGVPNIGHYAAMAINDPTTAEFPGGVNNNELLIGGGIRCNTDLQLLGDFFYYASARGNADPTLSFEGIQVAGNIQIGPTRDVNGDGVLNNSDLQAYFNHAINDPAIANNPASIAGDAIRASTDPLFSTHQGFIRDGSSQPDASGYARSIPRLDPPSLDTYVNGSGVLRYRALTRDSGVWVNNGGTHYNTGFNGWGTGIYINNPLDLQPETLIQGTGGGYSLPRDWTNPKAGYSSAGSSIPNTGWQGLHYEAPGLVVDLQGDRLVLTRDDGQKFTNPDGTPITQQGGSVVQIPLADANGVRTYVGQNGTTYTLPPFPHDGDNPALHPNSGQPYGDPNSYGVDVVLFAEGNVRVRGFFGAVTDSRTSTPQNPQLGRVHLTIVTGGTAYIEGNIVKNDGYLDSNGNLIMERNSTCAILAHDYVCVNPTVFMAPVNTSFSWTPESGTNLYYTEIGQNANYDTIFSWGVNPNTYTVGGTALTPFLMLSHSSVAPSGPAYLNLKINPALDNGAGNSLYVFPDIGPPVQNTTPPSTTDVIGYYYDATANQWFPESKAVAPNFAMLGFQLNNVTTGISNPGFENILRFELNPNPPQVPGAGPPTDYYLNSAMVAPLDIRIEALLYAEHRSFFVIPGYHFNENTADTRQSFAKGNGRQSYNTQPGDTATDKARKDLYPFYGEPMDVRVTIYGAIAENYTASQGDQTYWMENWGYIPATYGSSTQVVPDDHRFVHDPPGYNPAEDRAQDFRTPFEAQTASVPAQYKDFEITRGLRFVYDPAFAMPYGGTVQNGNILGGPRDPNLMGISTLVQQYRQAHALRFIDRPPVIINNTTVLPEIRQVLPPLPRLPVCPGLLYYGDSERPIT